MTSAFNFRAEHLDEIETAIRDDLGVNIEHWARFRRAINCGSSAEPPVLTFSPGAESDLKKEAFLDLGKSNYEIICCLGFAKQTLIDIQALPVNSPLTMIKFMRLSREFYFNAGSVLDNFARLIYIINDSASDRAVKRRQGVLIPRRRWVAWGDFESQITQHHPNYVPFVNDADMQKFRNIRHFLTHVWAPPKMISKNQIHWPEEIQTNRVYAWPHDPLDAAEFNALTFVPVITMMQADWIALERFQNAVFQQLSLDVTAKFEPNFRCTILPIT